VPTPRARLASPVQPIIQPKARIAQPRTTDRAQQVHPTRRPAPALDALVFQNGRHGFINAGFTIVTPRRVHYGTARSCTLPHDSFRKKARAHRNRCPIARRAPTYPCASSGDSSRPPVTAHRRERRRAAAEPLASATGPLLPHLPARAPAAPTWLVPNFTGAAFLFHSLSTSTSPVPIGALHRRETVAPPAHARVTASPPCRSAMPPTSTPHLRESGYSINQHNL